MLFIHQNSDDIHRVATASWHYGNGQEKSYIGCQKLKRLSVQGILSTGRRKLGVSFSASLK